MHNKSQSITLDYIAQFLPDNPIIVEAGANIGRDTIKLAKKFPQGTIYAFEPVPELYKKLKLNTEDYENIKIFEKVLCDKNRKITFNVCKNIGAISSLLEPTEILEKFSNADFEKIIVEGITLDSWIMRNKIPRVDFMWLDLQGAELSVLKSSMEVLKNLKAIQVEVSLTQRYSDMPLYDEIRSWLETQGFKVDRGWLHHTTWGNILFIKAP